MKKNKHKIQFIAIGVLFAVVGVVLVQKLRDTDEMFMKEYYDREDFETITVGKSTYQDVYNIAPVESMQITSYGAFCEYPTQKGGCIRIKFMGKDMVVGAVEEILLAESD